MNSFRILDRQARRVVAAVVLLAATVMPALVPALVAAETVTQRSVALSSSVKDTSNVSYEVQFHAQHAGTGAFIMDLCDSAAIGTTCTSPAGVDTTSVATSTSGYTVSAANSNKGVKVLITTPVGVDGPVDVTLTGIHNPTAAGTLYARIVTYADDTAVGTNTSASPGTHYDDGSVALAITDGFSVSGSVLESLTFCASGSASAIGTSCSTNVTSPNLTLGSNGVLTNTPAEGTIKTQVSTNAAHGVAVWLKNSTPGGGLKRAEASDSDITPFYNSGSAAADIGTGTAKFGLKLANLTGGTAVSGNYSTTGFFMDYKSDGTQGITSAYGSQIYDTSGAPISDGTADLTFAANTSNLTPAGSYSAALNLIATGKF